MRLLPHARDARPDGAGEADEERSRAAIGRIALRRLDWDSTFFGAQMGAIALTEPSAAEADSAGRIDALAAEVGEIVARARAERYDHLIFRVPAEDFAAIWAAERAGLKLVDVGIDSTFAFGSVPLPEASGRDRVRPVRQEDLPALRELAASAFVYSRFWADPFFSPEQVAAFHREWVTNLCAGLAQAVLVYDLDDQAIGFVSCAMTGDEGRIPLIATQAAHRGQGVGRSLISAALRWFVGAGARVAHVKTQAHNYPALALYHRSGFTVRKSELTFSITLR